MSKQRRLLLGLGAFAGGLAAAAVVPTAIADADACSLGECDLVQAGAPTDVSYEGFRPLFTDWWQTMPVNVDVTEGGVATVSGSYSVSEEDYATPFFDDSAYTYSSFTPAAGMTGTDSDGLAGAQVYDLILGPGTNAAGQLTYGLDQLDIDNFNGLNYAVTIVPGSFTNILESNSTGSADFLELPGQATQMLWDSLPSTAVPDLATLEGVLPPDNWFP